MHYDVEVFFQGQHDPFAESAHLDHSLSFHGIDRWLHASQDEWRCQSHSLERAASDARTQCVTIKLDVGELGHG
jgi:hypothetical protein